MTAGFAFPKDTVAFLRELGQNNAKAWFDANRARYDAAYVEAGKDFVEAAAPLLETIAPGISAEPRINGSIFRINRDIRFSKDKTPYKDHLDFWFWHGERKTAVSGLFARVAPYGLVVGAGCHGFSREALPVYRAAIERSEAELRTAVDGLERAGYVVSGSPGTPEDDHVPVGPRLAKCRALFTVAEEPVAVAHDPKRLLVTLGRHWTAMAPLHAWLLRHVQAR